VGRSLIVYCDQRDATHNITKTGLDSRRGWMFLLSIFSVAFFFIGGLVFTMTRDAPPGTGVSRISSHTPNG
jgi:hypothetical protein